MRDEGWADPAARAARHCRVRLSAAELAAARPLRPLARVGRGRGGELVVASYLCASHHDHWAALPGAPGALVAFQLEPLALWAVPPCFSNATYLAALARATVWDYSPGNADFLAARGFPDAVVELLRLRDFPGLVPSPPRGRAPGCAGDGAHGHGAKSVDVLFIGAVHNVNTRRKDFLLRLRAAGATVEVLDRGRADVDPFSRAARAAAVRRARVVVNLHRGRAGDDFEGAYAAAAVPLQLARLHFLLAARAFVVTEEADPRMVAPLRAAGALVFAPFSRLHDAVLEWLARPEADRRAVADAGAAFARARSMADELEGPAARAIERAGGGRCAYRRARSGGRDGGGGGDEDGEGDEGDEGDEGGEGDEGDEGGEGGEGDEGDEGGDGDGDGEDER